MLVLEIALGIVLAVLILAFFRQIFSLGIILALTIGVLFLGFFVWESWDTEEASDTALIILALLGYIGGVALACFLWERFNGWVAKRMGIGPTFFLTAVLAVLVFLYFGIFTYLSIVEKDRAWVFAALCCLGVGAFLVKKSYMRFLDEKGKYNLSKGNKKVSSTDL